MSNLYVAFYSSSSSYFTPAYYYWTSSNASDFKTGIDNMLKREAVSAATSSGSYLSGGPFNNIYFYNLYALGGVTGTQSIYGTGTDLKVRYLGYTGSNTEVSQVATLTSSSRYHPVDFSSYTGTGATVKGLNPWKIWQVYYGSSSSPDFSLEIQANSLSPSFDSSDSTRSSGTLTLKINSVDSSANTIDYQLYAAFQSASTIDGSNPVNTIGSAVSGANSISFLDAYQLQGHDVNGGAGSYVGTGDSTDAYGHKDDYITVTMATIANDSGSTLYTYSGGFWSSIADGQDGMLMLISAGTLYKDNNGGGSPLSSDEILTWAAVCFPPFTLIETPHGLTQISDLKVGDEVITQRGIVKVSKNMTTQTPGGASFVFFPKDCICEGFPSEDAYITEFHPIAIKNVEEDNKDVMHFIEARHFINKFKGIELKKLETKTYHNLVFDTVEIFNVGGMKMCSHHPNNTPIKLRKDEFLGEVNEREPVNLYYTFEKLLEDKKEDEDLGEYLKKTLKYN